MVLIGKQLLAHICYSILPLLSLSSAYEDFNIDIDIGTDTDIDTDTDTNTDTLIQIKDKKKKGKGKKQKIFKPIRSKSSSIPTSSSSSSSSTTLNQIPITSTISSTTLITSTSTSTSSSYSTIPEYQTTELPKNPNMGDTTFIIIFLSLILGIIVLLIITTIILIIHKCIIYSRRIRLTNELPGAYDDAELEAEEDRRALDELIPNEQELYFQSKDYIKLNPINNEELTLSQLLSIQEKGVNAWEFKPHFETNNEIIIKNGIELEFLNENTELSVQTNYPLPKNNEVYYYECKIYELDDSFNDNTQDQDQDQIKQDQITMNNENPFADLSEDDVLIEGASNSVQPGTLSSSSNNHSNHNIESILSIGFATKPYPFFRLPGRNRFSISYDSNGDRRYNQPFKLDSKTGLKIFPKILKGDVIGIGYRTRTGTIFFTRNGKKLSETKIGGHIKNFKNLNIYPIIGSNNKCKIQVNMGSMGYVFIEGNVKKWGFGPIEGTGKPPPAYKKFNSDVLLDSSEIDPNDLTDRNGDFPPNFWEVNNNNNNNNNNSGNNDDNDIGDEDDSDSELNDDTVSTNNNTNNNNNSNENNNLSNNSRLRESKDIGRNGTELSGTQSVHSHLDEITLRTLARGDSNLELDEDEDEENGDGNDERNEFSPPINPPSYEEIQRRHQND
ncbi:hypothetical protein B5S29_g4794 [[Candida] boidinii]|nr:hypothetical protein B5S29_g4794 [[Candida] boidinii]